MNQRMTNTVEKYIETVCKKVKKVKKACEKNAMRR